MTFDEKVNNILINYEFQIIAMDDNDTGEKQRAEAKAALYKAIEEHIIGEDEEDYEDGTPEYLFYASRNGIKASQRQVLNPKGEK